MCLDTKYAYLMFYQLAHISIHTFKYVLPLFFRPAMWWLSINDSFYRFFV